MFKLKKAFTIIELLVSIFMFGIIISSVYITFTSLYKEFRNESKSIESEVEKDVGLQILRLDLTHAGYGISETETNKIFSCNDCYADPSTNKEFTLRTLFNPTNNKFQSWVMTVDNGTTIDNPDNITLNSSDKFVFINLSKELIKKDTWGNRPSGNFIAFYYENDNSTACSNQECLAIKYDLSTTNLPARCNPNTFAFLRKVDCDNCGEHIIDCLADFQVWFDYDTNSDGKIDNSEKFKKITDFSADNSTVQRKKIKRINFYLLIQEGGKDKNYNFNKTVLTGNKLLIKNLGSSSIECNNEDICLKLPNDYLNYRWKVIEYNIKPMDL